MNFTRLWEKLTGAPHQHSLADSVRAAKNGLSESARSINERLAPYNDAPDPFMAAFADLYEVRQEANIYRGPRG
jgi:hypothetical protein